MKFRNVIYSNCSTKYKNIAKGGHIRIFNEWLKKLIKTWKRNKINKVISKTKKTTSDRKKKSVFFFFCFLGEINILFRGIFCSVAGQFAMCTFEINKNKSQTTNSTKTDIEKNIPSSRQSSDKCKRTNTPHILFAFLFCFARRKTIYIFKIVHIKQQPKMSEALNRNENK